MISVSGVLRTMFTYSAPIDSASARGQAHCGGAVPRISAPIAEYSVSWMVVQNARKIWLR